MNIEQEVFKKSKVNFRKLISYGFKLINDTYYLEKDFYNNNFKAKIIVDKKGNVSGKVYDNQTNEEYTNIRLLVSEGFASNIRELYRDILLDIRNKCFNNEYFIFDQTNRISKYIFDKYNNKPEFLWDDTPGCGVFRNKNNNKWYGIIMNMDKSKIDKGTGEIEVMNVKINPNDLDNLLKMNGIYKAYHMNKKYWITIILNDTLKDKDIIKLIDNSYNLINK